MADDSEIAEALRIVLDAIERRGARPMQGDPSRPALMETAMLPADLGQDPRASPDEPWDAVVDRSAPRRKERPFGAVAEWAESARAGLYDKMRGAAPDESRAAVLARAVPTTIAGYALNTLRGGANILDAAGSAVQGDGYQIDARDALSVPGGAPLAAGLRAATSLPAAAAQAAPSGLKHALLGGLATGVGMNIMSTGMEDVNAAVKSGIDRSKSFVKDKYQRLTDDEYDHHKNLERLWRLQWNAERLARDKYNKGEGYGESYMPLSDYDRKAATRAQMILDRMQSRNLFENPEGADTGDTAAATAMMARIRGEPEPNSLLSLGKQAAERQSDERKRRKKDKH